MKILFKVLCIILAIMALPMMLLQPVIGAIMLIFAVLGIWKGNKMFEKKKEPAQAEMQPEPVGNQKTIKVAGISQYMDAVMVFAHENEEYEYTKKQIIKEEMEDEEIPEYNFYDQPVRFVYEPGNEYDSNAIAIYINELKIGYVPKEHISFIRNIVDSGRLVNAVCEFVGGNYKKYDSDSETLETTELNIGGRVTVTYKDEQ